MHTHIYIYSCGQNYWHPWYIYMIKRGCENESALLILLIFIKKINQNQTFHWIIRIVKGGCWGIIMKLMFFSNTRWTQLLVLLDILSKIPLKYIPIHIHNFEHSGGIMNMKLSSQGFLVHRNINTRENKAQIPLIIHHNEKKTNNIFLMCSKR